MKFLDLFFGKRVVHHVAYTVIYWAVFVFYLLILATFIFVGDIHWMIALGWAILFPLIVRLFNLLFSIFYKGWTGDSQSRVNARTVLSFVGAAGLMSISFITVIFALAFSLPGGSVVINASSNMTANDEYELSIGTLRGSFDDIPEIDIPSQNPNNFLPVYYEASVDEGTFDLIVERRGDNEVVWNEEVSGDMDGIMEIQAIEGVYDVRIETEEASGIEYRFAIQ
ncbi:hypothetical protein HUG15_19605 [Salicibibacter cibarius]|uniref:Uncharacterized protein n=1 Tax=Salicibibacter cibarius TaxID=2743000 RepID=A0A7T7CD31_9BACI|nr:hypothetical protein [Salicibibacter cibarius]QQK77569.1 hypothetical protein HUG15_19605 [Salicibibacter cibarius]